MAQNTNSSANDRMTYQLVDTKDPDKNEAELTAQDTATTDKGPKFGKRHGELICYFLILLFAYCTRTNMSLTIVAMTNSNGNENKDVPTFNWTNRNIILSSFFWGYIAPQTLVGWLMTRYGPKWFVIGGTVMGCLAGFLTPLVAVKYGSTAVIICRIITGLSQSIYLPAASCFISRWIPINERSQLGTFLYSAAPLSAVISMEITGAISASRYGWPMVFHFFGGTGVLWCLYYIFCGHNSPSEHPSIAEKEKIYIEKSSFDVKKKPLPTPWISILKSIPVWALLYSFTCAVLGHWLLLTQVPTYMNKIMHVNIQSNGILMASIYLVQWIMSLITGFTANYVINKKIVTISTARKATGVSACICPAIFLLFLAQCREGELLKGTILLMSSIGATGGATSSFFINSNDLSPNHSGVIQGTVNGMSHIFAMLAPLIVELMVDDESNPAQWKIVFYFASFVYASGALIFAIFGSGEIQPWNDITQDDSEEASGR